MKIILIAAVSNLGKIGDVVEVKNGYAKNFLVPSKKAICFTTGNYKIFESKRKEFEQQDQSAFGIATQIKEQITGKDVIIIENASDDGRLYGSVTSLDIAAKINAVIGQKAVSRANIFLKKPIKEIGIYEVKLDLHNSVEINARLIVTRSESEIQALLKAEKKNQKSDQPEAVEAVKTAESATAETEVKNKKPKKAKSKKAEVEA